MRVFLVPNTGKSDSIRATRELAEWLDSAGHETLLVMPDAETCDLEERGVPQTDIGQPDLAVALGGDGTIIKSVHLLGDVATPILGVNFGRLGFLSGAAPSSVTGAVEAALAGEAREEKRMTLQATVSVDGREVGHYHALNEVFVGRVGASRVLDLSVKISGRDLATYTCDGLITASPTGSTAYALSAGGPIVSPSVRALVFVPVAPHTLASRALVLAPDDSVEITCPSDRSTDVCLTVDGQPVPCRLALQQVRIWRGSRDVTLLKLDGHHFFDVAHEQFLGE